MRKELYFIVFKEPELLEGGYKIFFLEMFNPLNAKLCVFGIYLKESTQYPVLDFFKPGQMLHCAGRTMGTASAHHDKGDGLL